ncbi:Leucine-rich repeat protein kinase family protein [Hibiscus syriacus]|uniref:Leucine-rich repeat protein kinase family protein n=1 Tax=Hibiscus syriacus TaxID=106335 RepID=A0A6A3BQN8_HIBSY|nr:Leucine-rich repeat protein kinase family protein [Hibiscus syriacus]
MDLPPSSAPKPRLMCSYGGRIISRPQTKTLYYSGGENRLLTIPTTDNYTTTFTLSSLTTHLSTFLRLTIPFTLKFQLPNHDLDLLISVSTDDDLQIVLEEHKRISSSSTAASLHIRLFLFPVGNGDKTELTHPKRESWFVDALRSARVGLPPIKPFRDSIPSDECLGNAVSNVQAGTFQDQVGHIASMENRLCSNTFESDKKFADPSSGFEMHKPIHAYGFPVNLMHPPQQQTQGIHEDTHYVPSNMPGTQPVTPYYTVYYPAPQQQQPQYLHYQTNQPYPMYYSPIARTKPYSIPMQHGMDQATSISADQPQALPNAPLIPTQVVLKEVAAVPQHVADLASQQYPKLPAGHQHIHVPRTETETAFAGAQIQHQPQSCSVAAGETANQANKADDDPARVQMYKSQPPPPVWPSQYQTMTKATTLLLSEAMAKLHTDNADQKRFW